jgi:3-phenylpropionate/trans-cinnamate dioxygenase ferredoxin reductase component
VTTTDVVVGGGLAAARAVATLRETGTSTDVVLITEEDAPPYERPELSKGYLAGRTKREALDVHAPSWYVEHEVSLMLGRQAVSIDRQAHEVELDGGQRIGYTRLLLATGSAPIAPPLPGADLDGVLLLRRVADSDAIRTAISGGGPLVVLGGGWIGLEVAAVARSAGADVTLVEARPTPLFGVVGEQIGATFTTLHQAHGVTVRTGVQPVALRGSEGRVRGVELPNGELVPAEAVVVGIGVRPRTELAEAAGLEVSDGIVVDATLRTSDPAIWAAGDVANAWNDWAGRRLRVEHFATANDQGPFVGRSMGGSDQRWAVPPFFWSDQYDVGLEYRGWADPARSRLVVRGTAGDGSWQAFWLDADDQVTAAMHVNSWDDADAIARFVTERVAVDPEALADAARPLQP